MLIGLLGADIGLQISGRFAPPPQFIVGPQQPVDAKGRAETDSRPDYLAIATLIVLAFQAWIFLRQSRIMEHHASIYAGMRDIMSHQTGILDRQKEIVRQGHMAVHRPRLFVRNVVIKEQVPYFGGGGLIQGQLYIANRGSSSGLVTEGLIIVYWRNQRNLPMERPYEGMNGNICQGMPPVLAGSSIPQVFSSNELMAPDIGENIWFGKHGWKLYVMGWIQYRDGGHDIYNDTFLTRRTAFCREFDPATKRFVRVHDEDYEHEE